MPKYLFSYSTAADGQHEILCESLDEAMTRMAIEFGASMAPHSFLVVVCSGSKRPGGWEVADASDPSKWKVYPDA